MTIAALPPTINERLSRLVDRLLVEYPMVPRDVIEGRVEAARSAEPTRALGPSAFVAAIERRARVDLEAPDVAARRAATGGTDDQWVGVFASLCEEFPTVPPRVVQERMDKAVSAIALLSIGTDPVGLVRTVARNNLESSVESVGDQDMPYRS